MNEFVEVDRLPKRHKSILDIREHADDVGHLSPVDFARLRGILPQRVYAKIRTTQLKVYWCSCCGHGPYVNVAEALLAFMKKNPEAVDTNGR